MVYLKDTVLENLMVELDKCLSSLLLYDINAIMPLFYVLCAHHEGHLVSIIGENGSFFHGKMHIQPIETVDGYESPLLKEIRQLVSHSYFEGQPAELVFNFYSTCSEYINEFYKELIEHIFEFYSKHSGRYSGSYVTPSEVSKLIGHFILRNRAHSVYDPCAGLCTFATLPELREIDFLCSELDMRSKVMADIRMDAWGRDITLRQEDSTFMWRGEEGSDCLASELPFGIRLNNRTIEHQPSDLLEDYVISKFLDSETLTSAVLLVSAGTCSRSRTSIIRKRLCENNYVDTVIRLPRGILSNTSVDAAIVVLNKHRTTDDSILLVDGQFFVSKNTRGRNLILDIDAIKRVIDKHSEDASSIRLSVKDLDNNYSLLPNRYLVDTSKVENGLKLSDLIQVDMPRPYTGNMWTVSDFSDDWNKCQLTTKEVNDSTRRRVISYSGNELMVQFSNGRLMLGEIEGLTLGVKVAVGSLAIAFHIVNTQKIHKKYLLYALKSQIATAQAQAFATGEVIPRLSANDFLDIVIPCPSISDQEKIIRDAEDKYLQQLGLGRTSSDIAHMLGTPSVHIGNALKLLELSENLNEDDRKTLSYLKDNFEYMDRLMKLNSILDFSKQSKKPICLANFIRDYIDKWKSFGSNTFRVEFDGDENALKAKVSANSDALMIMFDCLFDNANRHGFHKKKSPDNEMTIVLLSEMKDGAPYIMLRVGNNGSPLDKDFSLNDYITRGRYKSDSGRSGLGGYHVNAVTQSMGGEISSILKSAEWTAFEFLIPIVNIEELDNSKFLQV